MKMLSKKGFSLIELLVVLPLITLVFLGMGYMIGNLGRFTAVKIAKTKTLVAANNVLMLMKAKGCSELRNNPDNYLNFSTNKTGDIIVDNKEIPTNSTIHPDGVTRLLLKIEEKPENEPDDVQIEIANGDKDTFSNIKICIVTVTAPGFEDVQTVIKTISF